MDNFDIDDQNDHATLPGTPNSEPEFEVDQSELRQC